MSACAAFRLELEQALRSSGGALARLGEHAHVHTCAACRTELRREEKLDALLESQPAPDVPTALARRILARLGGERSPVGCGALPEHAALPEGAALEDAELDELLGRLPRPRVPAGLAERVLSSVREAREPRQTPQQSRSAWRAWSLWIAAGLLVGLGLWYWNASRPTAPRVDLALGSGAELEADEELLTYAVERWELLQDEDLDLWLASLDPVDELLLEYAADESWLDDGARETPAREGE